MQDFTEVFYLKEVHIKVLYCTRIQNSQMTAFPLYKLILIQAETRSSYEE